MVGVVSAFRLVAAALVAAAWLIGTALHLLGSMESAVLLLVLLAFIIRELQTPFICWLQVLDRQGTVALLGVLPMVARLMLLAVLWRLTMVTVVSVLVASLFGDGLGLVAMGGMATRYGSDPGGAMRPWRLAAKLLRAAPMLTISQAILVMQSRFDWLLVAVFASYSALANYAIANKATELLVLSGAVFGRNALPWLVMGWSHPGVARTVRWLSVGVNFAALGLGAVRLAHIASRLQHQVRGGCSGHSCAGGVEPSPYPLPGVAVRLVSQTTYARCRPGQRAGAGGPGRDRRRRCPCAGHHWRRHWDVRIHRGRLPDGSLVCIEARACDATDGCRARPRGGNASQSCCWCFLG